MSPSSQGTGDRYLRFLWWNVQDFAHYDPTLASKDRWPTIPDEYQEKTERIVAVLRGLVAKYNPHLLAFAEITNEAAHAIRDRLFPGYEVHQLASLYSQPDFHISVLYDRSAGFLDEDFLAPLNLPNTARPMATVDHVSSGRRIRFYCCHWTARIADESEKCRRLSANALNVAAYDYLRGEGRAGEDRHVIILGDLNEEPYGLLETWLYSGRDRLRARSPEHPTDKPIHRVRLYNCSWRLLGERFAHPLGENTRDAAGTYYWRKERTWHTYDQVIVSGGLLGDGPPYLDEESICVACRPDEFPDRFLGKDGRPCKFEWLNGAAQGVSDHLPLFGRIVLS